MPDPWLYPKKYRCLWCDKGFTTLKPFLRHKSLCPERPDVPTLDRSGEAS